MVYPTQVQIVEVGPRDGLQNESQILSVAQRIELIDRLSACGLSTIEMGSFVRPDKIPPLANTESVAAGIQRFENISYSALVPNNKGLERALSANLSEIAIFMSSTEAHSQKNTNRSIAEALETYPRLVKAALSQGLRVRAYLSTVFGCPYEGPVKPQQVRPLVEQLLEMGAYQVSLGDTIGVSNPLAIQTMLGFLQENVPLDALALHLHDTRGTALANALAGLQMGIHIFDTSIGGLGGCPYAPGASGNLSTEDLVYMLHEMGIKTGIDLEQLVSVNQFVSDLFQRKLQSKYALAQIAAKK
jgi:hydroxymethylglutaryl-CoA lyase